MDDPDKIKKYLGCHHEFFRDDVKQIAGYHMQMSDFISSSCDVCTEKTVCPLRARRLHMLLSSRKTRQ